MRAAGIDPEVVLDDRETLARPGNADSLLDLAGAAAALRSGAAAAVDALRDLQDLQPRAVLVAGAAADAGAAVLTLAGPDLGCPLVLTRAIEWPTWAGVSDVIVVAADDAAGPEALVPFVSAAGRRGCEVVLVGTPSGAVEHAAAAARARVVDVRNAGGWGAVAAVAALAHRLGVAACSPAAVELAAERLAAEAVRARPDSDVFVNPAKALAVELVGTVPVVVGSGAPGASYAADHLARALVRVAAMPALSATPDDAAALLDALPRNQTDIFADRAEGSPAPGLRLVLVGADDGPALARLAAAGGASRLSSAAPVEDGTEAVRPDGPVHELRPEAEDPVVVEPVRTDPQGVRLAELAGWLLAADFVAAYVSIAAGAQRAGETE